MHYSSRCRRHILRNEESPKGITHGWDRRQTQHRHLAARHLSPLKGFLDSDQNVFSLSSSCPILTHTVITEAFTNRTTSTGQTPFACPLLCDDTRMISAYPITGAALFLYLQGLLHRVFCV